MLESVISWFTPTALFLLLNLVIGTIAFTSYLSSSAADPSAASKLFRTPSPSIILDRFKSFNLYSSSSSSSSSSCPSNPATTEILKSQQCEPEPEPKPVTKPEAQPEQELPIVRSQSETQLAAGDMRKKLPKKMKKSATLNHFDFHEPEQESPPLKRPATMREREREREREKVQKEEDAVDDAKADDFINRFRQQLKLQRSDSIIRYKEMLSRGN